MIRTLLPIAALLSLLACGGDGASAADTSCEGAKVQILPPASAKVNQEVDVELKLAIDAACVPGGGDLDVRAEITDPAGNPVNSSGSSSTTLHTDPTTMDATVFFTPQLAGTYHVSGSIANGLRTFDTDVEVGG